jgi:ribulose-bisphosphate carboxylase large chain
MATVAGNLSELRPFSGLRLLDLRLPAQFLDAYPGPQFAVEGTRRLTGVERLPLVGTIIKPSVGLTPEATAEMVRSLAVAGIDLMGIPVLLISAGFARGYVRGLTASMIEGA